MAGKAFECIEAFLHFVTECHKEFVACCESPNVSSSTILRADALRSLKLLSRFVNSTLDLLLVLLGGKRKLNQISNFRDFKRFGILVVDPCLYQLSFSEYDE